MRVCVFLQSLTYRAYMAGLVGEARCSCLYDFFNGRAWGRLQARGGYTCVPERQPLQEAVR